MVAVFLLGIVTTLMAGFFSYFTRQSLRYSQREFLLGSAEKAMARLQITLGESRLANVVQESTIAGLYFPVADTFDRLTFDTTGTLTWQAWEAFGYDATAGTFWEARRALGTDTVGKAPSTLPASWTGRRIWATRVRGFTITGPSDGVYSFRLLLQDNTGYQVEFVTSVRPLN